MSTLCTRNWQNRSAEQLFFVDRDRRIASDRQDINVRRIEPVQDPQIVPRHTANISSTRMEGRLEVLTSGQGGHTCQRGQRRPKCARANGPSHNIERPHRSPKARC